MSGVAYQARGQPGSCALTRYAAYLPPYKNEKNIRKINILCLNELTVIPMNLYGVSSFNLANSTQNSTGNSPL